MSRKITILFSLMLAFLVSCPAYASGGSEGGQVNVKEIIFHHLGDGYGWEVPFSHTSRIPLPVIVRTEDGNWFCFSSSRLTELKSVAGEDG
ncbi:MAG TPA: F0F1 ATP synthase subunit A, partial [Porphyromonadaceae bacterium]|nr:F0F1 ATP synthase subunit A [Porphyromonadaceae bacterium]